MKDLRTSGNSSPEAILRSLVIAVLVVVLAASPAAAQPCAVVGGDATLAPAIAALLAGRGVGADLAACAPVRARVERRGDAIVVALDDAGALPVERVVGDAATAATVIESWARVDVAAPLLAARALPVVAARAPTERAAAPLAVVVAAPARAPRALQVFAALETSIASDGTRWLGPQLGACVMVGPICAAARLRFANVIDGPGPWHDHLDRKGGELLIGGDIPFPLGRGQLAPGFGGGLGAIGTHVSGDRGEHIYNRTGGLRADVHATLSYPLGHQLALDVTLAADFTQTTHVETDTTMVFPDEPWLLVRAGVGVRYGGP